nr:hypothetical protein [uncultured Gammaproteobacteria bacterium]
MKEQNQHRWFFIIVLGLAMACGLGIIAYFIFGKTIIASIYHGTARPLLNFLITQQAVHPLDYYYSLVIRTILSAFVFGCAGIAAFFYGESLERNTERHLWKIASGILLLSGIYSASTFFGPFCLARPLVQLDYAIHYAGSLEVVQHLQNRFQVWGYNPFLCAGFRSYGLNNIWSAIFLGLLGWLNKPEFIFNCSVFLTIALPPLLALGTARLSGLSSLNSLFFLVSAIFLTLGFGPICGRYFSGGYGFVIATWLTFFLAGLTHAYLVRPKKRLLLLLVALGIFTLFTHPLSAVMLPILFVPYCIANYRLFTISRILALGLSAVAVMAVFISWMFPLFAAEKTSLSAIAANLQTYNSLFFETVRGDRPFALMLILVLYVLYYLIKQGRYLHSIITFLPILAFFMLAFFGTQLQLGGLEPSRFIIPLAIACLLAAAGEFQQHITKKSPVFIALVVLLFVFLIRPPVPYAFGYDANPAATRIMDFFQKAPKTGRVLIQTSWYGRPYFDSHIPAQLCQQTSFETTANTFPGNSPAFQQFIEGLVWGRELSTFTVDSLLQYCNLYNIEYILTYRPKEQRILDSVPFLQKVLSENGYSIYKNASASKSFCMNGDALVSAGYDRIIVNNSKQPITILKYHYFPRLKIKPDSLSLFPILLLADPIPFIGVRNGTCSDFEIRFSP